MTCTLLLLSLGMGYSTRAGDSPRSVKTFGAKGDGSTDDTAALEKALRAKASGPLLFPAGTYKITRCLSIRREGVQLTGEGAATILALTGNFAIESGANNITISGLTFDGAGFHGTAQLQSGIILTNNHFQNTKGKDAVVFDGILTGSRIDSNVFYNIAPEHFLSATYSSLGFPGCWSHPSSCDLSGTGIVVWGGLDQTSITKNSFDVIANDGMHIGWNYIGDPALYFLTRNNNISYNQLSRVHRIGLELQAIWQWPHCGVQGHAQCDVSKDYSTNTQVKGNYFHDPFLAYTETYAYSLALWGDGQYINNAAIENVPGTCMGHTGYGIENMGSNVLTQGNVVAADYLPDCNQHGWYPIVYGPSRAGATFTTQNNVICGDRATTSNFGREPNAHANQVDQYNYVADVCANASRLATSTLTLRSATPTVSQAGVSWRISATSALPIKYVQFFLDGSPTPLATQEIQDVNTTFAKDRNWLYHATLSRLTPGKHTLTAKATDVSGAVKQLTEEFSAGVPVP